MGRRLQSGHLGSRATAADAQFSTPLTDDTGNDAFDFDVEPYGPVEPDEASWFVSANRGGHAAPHDEREARALVVRLLGT
jgi:hypothetical protein